MELTEYVAKLQWCDASEKRDLEYHDAKRETIIKTWRQQKAEWVYKCSLEHKNYASKLAEKWGKDRTWIQQLRKEGEQLTTPDGCRAHGQHQLEGIKQGVAKLVTQSESKPINIPKVKSKYTTFNSLHVFGAVIDLLGSMFNAMETEHIDDFEEFLDTLEWKEISKAQFITMLFSAKEYIERSTQNVEENEFI